MHRAAQRHVAPCGGSEQLRSPRPGHRRRPKRSETPREPTTCPPAPRRRSLVRTRASAAVSIARFASPVATPTSRVSKLRVLDRSTDACDRRGLRTRARRDPDRSTRSIACITQLASTTSDREPSRFEDVSIVRGATLGSDAVTSTASHSGMTARVHGEAARRRGRGRRGSGPSFARGATSAVGRPADRAFDSTGTSNYIYRLGADWPCASRGSPGPESRR